MMARGAREYIRAWPAIQRAALRVLMERAQQLTPQRSQRKRSRRSRELDLEQAITAAIDLIGKDFHQPTEEEVIATVADREEMSEHAIASRWQRAQGEPITIGEVRTLALARLRASLMHLD
jgi:hypothetical protein